MNKKKSIIFIIICLIAFIIILPSKIYAEEDIEPPVVDETSIEINNKNATIGDTVTISVTITDNNNNIQSASLYYTKPITLGNTDWIRLKYNDVTKKFEAKIEITNNWQSGIYSINYISASDGLNSKIYYNNKNKNTNYYGKNYDYTRDFSLGDFTIYGTETDVTAPTIDQQSLCISSDKAIIGDKIKYSIKITDDTEIGNVILKLRNKDGNSDRTISLYPKYNSNTDKFEGEIEISSDLKYGRWDIDSIGAYDKSDNSTYIYNSKLYNYSKIYDWSNIYFYNYQNPTEPVYIENSLEVSRDTVTVDESVEISLRASDVFGIKNIKVTYIQPETNLDYVIDLKEKNEEYSQEISFNQFGYNGIWKIKNIEITSIRDAITTIYNNKTNSVENAIDLSSGDFESHGLINDTAKPEITSYSVDKNSILYGDRLTMSIDAIDSESGIKKVWVNYTSPDSKTKDYECILNENKYIYSFDFDNSEKVGKYKINYIAVEDNIGNVLIKEDELSNLNFEFREQIHIIAPTKFLKTTSSYQLEALTYPANENLKDITWQSSDTSIATINSKTGILSTTYKQGEVKIYAYASDGSGMYGSIKLIVAGVAIKVGEKTSISNSSYTSYSSVIWEIEDETILRKTGNNGYIAINNSYKHSCEVEGLKSGETYVKMCTPSGAELLKAKVYVYDSISKINCEYTQLTMEKGKTIDLNISVLPDTFNKEDEIVYVSGNDNIATVDTNGKITAVNKGDTNITIYSKNSSSVKLTIPVTVVIYTSDIQLNSTAVNLNNEKQTYQIEYTVLPDDATNKKVKFTSEDENIAKVNSDGKISAIRNGQTKIIIETEDGKQREEIDVNIEGFLFDINDLEYREIDDMYYTGNELEPEIELKDLNYVLQKNKDYEISFSKNTNVGTAEIEISGIGKYKGTLSKTFKILPKNIAETLEMIEVEDKTYTGSELIHNIEIKDGEKTLEQDTDYTVSYNNNKKVGDATVTIECIGNYSGSTTKTFKILPKNIESVEMMEIEDKTYTGNELEQNIVLKDGKTALEQNKDYTISYQDNKNVGIVTTIIEGIGNYTGSITKTFKIIPKNIDAIEITGIIDKVYTGKNISQSIALKDGYMTLKQDIDFTVTYKNNQKVGTATVTIEGIGNYIGTLEKTFKIMAKSVSKLSISGITDKTYTGKALKQAITIKYGNIKLTEGQNYVLIYSANKKIGIATVSITGKGNYTGTIKKTFKINPKGTSLKKITKGRKQFKVIWNKNAKQTSGYEIQYSINSKFKKGNKKVNIKKNKTTSKTVKNLKAKKKYYVRIRTYKTVNGKKYYSGWSKILNVKTK